MTMKSTFITTLILFTFVFSANTQVTTDFSLKTLKSLKDWSNLTQEKAYLSFDKPYYLQGETMRFQAFMVDAVSHGVDSISAVLYVELMDATTNKLMDIQNLKIEKSRTHGSFETTKIPSGEYLVHAYTRWMQNAPSDFNFYKKIRILDTKPTPSVLEAKSKKIALQFFPEGGNLVDDLPSVVGFKATDENGNSVSIKGTVFNEKGDSILSFQDDKFGMGRFFIKPSKSLKYIAKIKLDDGSIREFNLPQVQTNGIILTLDNSKDDLPIRVFAYLNMSPEQMPSSFFLLAHVRGKTVFASKVSLTDKNMKTFRATIPREKLADVEGIVTFTIFDDKGIPLCERLFFHQNPQKRLDIAIKTDKTSYNKREEIKIDIESKDILGKPIASNLGFVATINSVAPPQYFEHLMSYFLLRSDLKGHIESSSFYFQDTSKIAKKALDNLMLTQGWSRFSWQNILKEKQDSILFLPEYGIPISGVVTRKGQPLKNSSLFLTISTATESPRFAMAKTDEKGFFSIQSMPFSDTARVLVKVINTLKDFEVSFIKPEKAPSVFNTFFSAVMPSENIQQYLASVQNEMNVSNMIKEKEILLKEVEVKAKKKAPKADSRNMTYRADKSLNLEDAATFGGTILDYLRFQNYDFVETDNGEIRFLPLTRSYGQNTTPMLLVDGQAQEDVNILRSIMVADVEKVDISRTGTGMSAYFNSDVQYEGVISVLTKAGNPNYTFTPYNDPRYKDSPSTLVMGFAVQKQTYMPDYSEKKPEHDLPDLRSVLHWSPTLRTDTDGKTTLRFFTSDNVGTMRIFVEGIDAKGRMGVKEMLFEVHQ
jgi:hypothetical protein